jgi:hypothetical protein
MLFPSLLVGKPFPAPLPVPGRSGALVGWPGKGGDGRQGIRVAGDGLFLSHPRLSDGGCSARLRVMRLSPQWRMVHYAHPTVRRYSDLMNF